MDLRWQMAILTMRAKRFLKKTRRKLTINVNETLGFNISKVECYNYHKRGHFVRECRALRNQDFMHTKITRRSVPVETPASKTLVSCDGLGRYDWSDQAEEGPSYALMAYISSSSDSKIVDNCKKRLGYESYNAVLPPYTRNFMPPKPDLSFTGLDEFVKPEVENSHDMFSEDKTKVVRKNGNPQMDLQDKGVIDSGFSRHITRNMSYLTDYEEIDRGCSGPNWLFDIDALTRIMNYEPIVTCTQSNGFAGIKASNNVGQARKETSPVKDYILLPLWTTDLPFSEYPKNSQDDGFKPSSDDGKKDENDDAVADMNNLDTTIQVSPSLTIIIHKDHHLDQVIKDLHSATQTRNMLKNLEERSHTQEEGIDYDEVFALVARFKAIRLFLAYALFKDFVVYQLDVKSAFLYGKIEEEVYVCQPQGFEDSDFSNRVYKVKKALYGLHQAPRAWYEMLSTYLLNNGFQRGKIDKTLFIKRHKGDILLVQVYVDTIIFGLTRKELCNAFKKLIHKKFQMSSMGKLTFFLGLQVKQKNDGIFICQDKYVPEILKKFGFTGVKNESTPIETQKPMLKDKNGEEVDVHMYRLMIGSLMYLTSSRPDIMFSMCACARYQVNPKVLDLDVVKRIFRYLKGQPKLGLWYPKDSPFDLVAYTDSDYAGVSLDRKSTTGGCKAKKSDRLMMDKLFEMELELILLFRSTTMTKTINEDSQIHSRVDGKEIIITESSVMRDLRLADEDGVDCLLNSIIFENLELMRLVRAATITSCLEAEQDSDNIDKTQSKATLNEKISSGTTSGGGPRCQEAMGDTIAQTRFENVSKHSNDSLLVRGNTLQSNENSLKLNELMELCTNLQSRVLALEKTKTTQALEINRIKRRVKKLEKKQRSRTHKLKRLYKVGLTTMVDSSKDEPNLGEDASKHERIKVIDADEDITLVNDQDAEIFNGTDLHGEEVFVEKDADKEVNAASIAITNSAAATITTEEVTLAKALTELKLQNPRKCYIVYATLGEKKKVLCSKKSKRKEEQTTSTSLTKKIMCTNLKNIEGKKLTDLKNKSLDSIQKMFDKAFKRVNTFEPISSELVEGSLKRAGEEIEQERLKKQKVDDDKETNELKKLMEIIPNEEQLTIHATLLAVNSPKIVDWKIHKGGKKSYYQIIRVDGDSKMYMVFSRMLNEFNQEDLEDLYSLVKAKYGSTRPMEDLDFLLWGDLKTMFEPHLEDQKDASWIMQRSSNLSKMHNGNIPWHGRIIYRAAKNRFMELNELMELQDGAYENTRIYKERTKRWHDSKLRGDKNFMNGEKDQFKVDVESLEVWMGHQLVVPKDVLFSKCVLKVILGGTHAILMGLDLLIIRLQKSLEHHTELTTHNLVRGLPTKCFENNHTCTACLKGKQHKASFVTDDFSKFTWTFFLKTKDETSGILRKFITEIENLKDLKVKIIRCDNMGEFRNKEMNDFCSQKGIKREFSNARNPQQNGVAERRNRTLIEAARTMVLDNKSHKTPYELFNGRTPAIGFLKPFRCHVMILNSLDHLGKFEAKRDEGYFIRYSMSSKAFRVFNKRTKRVKENLHVDFLEKKAIEKGTSLNWLFDIDSLTKSMNYVPVVVTESSSSQPQDTCNFDKPKRSGNSNPTATSTNPTGDQFEILTVETPITTFEDILGVTTNSDESNGVEADVSNMETTITASPTPTLRIHKDHPKSQIIVYQMDVKSAFLYGTIDEEVYVMQPLGFQDPEFLVKVFKVEKAMNGLHQAPRACYDVRSSNTPMDKENPWEKDGTGKDVDLHLYRSMIGSLMYLTASRPDIMFAVCACARHQVIPKECHLHSVKRIFRYLKGYLKLGLWYPKESPFDLVAYSDIDYGGATQDHKLTTRGCQFLGRRLISWQCKKQTIVATSTTEAEYVTATSCRGQFWSTAKIETTKEGTKILTTVNGKLQTVSESSIKRNLKLNDEAGISSLPDAELFENLQLMGYNILPNQKFTFQKGQFSRQWKYLIYTIMQCLSPKSTRFNEFSSNIATALGEGSGTPTESHHTPSPKVQQTSPTTHTSSSLPPVTTVTIPPVILTKSLPTVIPFDNPPLRQYTRRTRIARSFVLPPVVDEPASELEINSLKARIKVLEDKDSGVAEQSRDDAPIKGRRLDEGEEAAKRVKVATVTVSIPTSSGVVSTASPTIPTVALIFTTATESTPYTRRKGKETMVEFETPKQKKVQEQIDVQLTRQLEEEMARDAQRMNEQIARDAKIARIHAEEELIELISDLVKYQENYAQVLKYQTLQRKPRSKKQKKDYYMAVQEERTQTRAGKCKEIKDIRRIPEEVKSSEEVPKEKVKEMMQLVPVEETYVEALQVKHLIIDWKHFDKEDLNKLWALVKESLRSRPTTSDKEKELWVKLKRLFEPDVEDYLWTHTQNLMHASLEWKLYDTCGVHHVSTRDQDIFMLIEKDYPLRKGLALVMICYMLQVENYSQMANDLILKIYKIANSPRHQDD
nr:retrovirus-related Pol polyprotein from transposon TNT 1-94 [Tanacetum cinerariifolium]